MLGALLNPFTILVAGLLVQNHTAILPQLIAPSIGTMLVVVGAGWLLVNKFRGK